MVKIRPCDAVVVYSHISPLFTTESLVAQWLEHPKDRGFKSHLGLGIFLSSQLMHNIFHKFEPVLKILGTGQGKIMKWFFSFFS